jgi:hypothetical protein
LSGGWPWLAAELDGGSPICSIPERAARPPGPGNRTAATDSTPRRSSCPLFSVPPRGARPSPWP